MSKEPCDEKALTGLMPTSRLDGLAGLKHFRGTLGLVEQHLRVPTTPEMSLSRSIDDGIRFRVRSDRRRDLVNVLPYRERRAWYR